MYDGPPHVVAVAPVPITISMNITITSASGEKAVVSLRSSGGSWPGGLLWAGRASSADRTL
jgi:hypothetical protein